MAPSKPVAGSGDGPVAAAVRKEIGALRAPKGELAPIDTTEAARALNLAAILDDRDGIQAGGVASTDKRLGDLLEQMRDRYKVRGVGRLELLRGGTG